MKKISNYRVNLLNNFGFLKVWLFSRFNLALSSGKMGLERCAICRRLERIIFGVLMNRLLKVSGTSVAALKHFDFFLDYLTFPDKNFRMQFSTVLTTFPNISAISEYNWVSRSKIFEIPPPKQRIRRGRAYALISE